MRELHVMHLYVCELAPGVDFDALLLKLVSETTSKLI
jgi:hypothetical protein